MVLYFYFPSCIQFDVLFWSPFKLYYKRKHFSFFTTRSFFLQWSLWSVGGRELVPRSQQPLLHLQ